MTTCLKNLIAFVILFVMGTAWAEGESINIKFNGGTFNADADYGCYPVKGSKWHVVEGGTVATGIQIDEEVTVSYATSAKWSMAKSGFEAHVLLDSYLDDGVVNDGGTTITVSGLDTTKFAQYDVLIYMTADTTPNVGKHFRAPVVNGVAYTSGGEGTDNWGTVYSYAKPIIGVNCLKVEGLHATAENNTLTIEAPGIPSGNRSEGRACISAIQIVAANSIATSVCDSATSRWTFENSIADLRGGVASWTGDAATENAFVDSLRKNESGVAYKAAKMSGALHPYASEYVWTNQVTIAIYANVEKCPDNGVLISSGGKTKLRKLSGNQIGFGDDNDDNYYCLAELDTLSSGYHLIVATRDADNGRLSLQIDGGAPVVLEKVSDISNGIQIGAEWGGGTHSYTADGGAIIDDVLVWDKILTADEISELVAIYPAIVPLKLEGEGPHLISSLIESGIKSTDIISLEDGAILNIDTIPDFKVPVISTGVITVKITNPEITLEEAQEIIDLTGTGQASALEIGYEYGKTAEDEREYARLFYGTADAFWNTKENWYIGSIDDGKTIFLIPQTETAVPGAAKSEIWHPILIDGELIGDNIAVGEDGFKTVSLTNNIGVAADRQGLEGWNLRLGVMNGVHLKISEIRKLQSQSDNNNTGWITVDETSKMTIGTLGSQGNNTFGGEFNIFGLLVVTNDFTATGNNPGYNYSLGKSGKVEYQGLSSVRTHNIKSVILDLGDPALTGKTIISRQLIAFTNQVNQTFAYDSNGVTSTVDQAEVAFRASLANVGEYNFEVKADGYYVNYVAYNETDDFNVVSTWTPEDANSQWTDETLWSNGRCPDSGDIVIDTSRLNVEISIRIPASYDSVIPASYDSVLIMGNSNCSTSIDFSQEPGSVEVYGNVVLTGALPGDLVFGKGSEIVINDVNSADVTIPSGVTVVLNGSAEAVEGSNGKEFGKFIVSQGGRLKTYGYLALTLQSDVNGEFDVCDGKAVVTTSDKDNRVIKGPIYVRRGATLAPQTTDSFNYSGPQEMHVYGTLAMGRTRWTTGGDNTIYLYGGAAVTGDGNNEGNIDFNASGAGHIVVKQNQETGDSVVNFSAALRSKNNDSGTIVVDPGVTLVMSGKLINAQKITKSGAGALVFDTPTGSDGGYIWVAEGSVGGKGFVQNITMAPGTVLQPVPGGLSVNGFYVNPSDTENGVILNSGRIDPEAISAGAELTLLTVKSDTINLSQSPIVNSMGSRYQTAISEKTIVATVKEGLPANFFHYDFNSEDGNTSANAASDSTWQLDSWGDVDGEDMRVPSRNGKAARLFYQNDGKRFCAYWGGNSADESPFHAGAGTIVSVLKPQDTDKRVVWALGSGNASGVDCVALAVDDDNTLSLIKKDGAKIVSVTGIKNLTSAYHFVAAICTPEATTLMVDDLVASSGPTVLNTIDGRGQLGSTHGANPPGYSRQGANGCYLDDWAVYDAVLTMKELRALRSLLTPRPFVLRIR